MKEIFQPIPNYEGLYEVSNKGRVRSLDRKTTSKIGKTCLYKGRILSPSTSTKYKTVRLSKDGQVKTFSIHILMSMAFMDHNPKESDLVVDHINNKKMDNRLKNLQLITHRENISKDKKGSSKYTGVSWHKPSKKWLVHIQLDGKIHHLGLFENEEEAAQKYKDALNEYLKNKNKK